MAVQRAGRKRRSFPILEALESRQLLTVDITGAFTALPLVAPSGSKQALTLAVSNGGDARASGMLAMDMYAAPDGQAFDTLTATFLGRFTRSIAIAGTGGVQSISLTVPLSAALAAGDYRLYAVLDPNARFTETDESNNTATSAVISILQPDDDLEPTFTPFTSLLPSIVAGVTSNAAVGVIITNPGTSTASVPAGVVIKLQIVARPVGAIDNSQDVVLNRSPFKVSVGGLAPGKIRAVMVPIQYPVSLVAGDYNIVAVADSGNDLAETDEANNEDTFGSPVSVAAPFSDPALSLNTSAALPSVVVADNRKLPLPFNITNLGNVVVPANQFGSIGIVAHDIDTDTDYPLQTFNNIPLGGLRPGQHKTVVLSPPIVNTLPNDHFRIDATLATTLLTDNLTNDAASTDDLGLSPFTVGPPFFDIAATLASSSFAPAVLDGARVSGSVNVGIANLSNTTLPAVQHAAITVSLRPAGATSNAFDTVIGTAPSVSIAGLAMGATRNFSIAAAIPDTAADGDYILVVSITPLDGLLETTAANNEASGNALKIAPPFTDLAITSASNTFTVPSPNGTQATGTVILRNMGNTMFQRLVSIEFFATLTSSINDGFFIGAGSFQVNLFPGQSTSPQVSALQFNPPNNGFLSGIYHVVARINPSGFSDAVPGDDQHNAGNVTFASQLADLVISSATNPFGSTANGSAGGAATVSLLNIGAGLSTGLVTVTYYATTSSTLDDSAVAIGATTVNIFLTSVTTSAPITVNLVMPNPPAPISYNLFARITSSSAVDNVTSNNATSIIGSVLVTPV